MANLWLLSRRFVRAILCRVLVHKRSRAVNRFVKNRKANFGSPIEGNPKYSGQKKPKWIFHLTSTEISEIFGIMHLSMLSPRVGGGWATHGNLIQRALS